VSPVKYELGFYIPEDDILHSHSRETLYRFTPAEKTTEYPLDRGCVCPFRDLDATAKEKSSLEATCIFEIEQSLSPSSGCHMTETVPSVYQTVT
jgi:hypothetical protein